jgi:hypothetical protein
MQVYNLGVSPQTHQADATIEYDLVKVTATSPSVPPLPEKPVAHLVESTAQMGNVGEQVTLRPGLRLSSLTPGTYEITVKVTDKVSHKSLEPTPRVRFTVE